MRPAAVTRSVLSVWLAATFAGADADCASAGRPAPSILLVTLDTTRADHIGAYGYGGAATPTVDRLAREGILFEHAVAPAPVTLPSHASMLTGVYPTAHGVHNNGNFSLSPKGELVSEVLSRHGWRTAAFVGSFVLDARFGLDQGFEVYDGPSTPASLEPAVVGIYGALRSIRRPANQVVDAAVAWLSTLSPGEKFFAWVHLFDPHEPHRAPEPWRSRLENPYDAEIAFCDAQIERLLRFLEKRGLTENLLTVVVGDHGESLGEHGERSHGMLLYQSATRVPLVISGAHVADSKGTRVAHPVSIADLAPTFLSLPSCPRAARPRRLLKTASSTRKPASHIILSAGTRFARCCGGITS
jgi:arylsulfatase A-like enzyme